MQVHVSLPPVHPGRRAEQRARLKFSDELPDELYSKLNSQQIARLSQVGVRRSVPAGESFSIRGRSGATSTWSCILLAVIVRHGNRCCGVGRQTRLVSAANGDGVDSSAACSHALGSQVDVMSVQDHPIGRRGAATPPSPL